MRTLKQWQNYQQLELIPDITSRKIHLSARQLWSGKAAPGIQLICERGSVWLTQSHDAHDYILRPGQGFLAPCYGKVVVQALATATISVTIDRNKLVMLTSLMRAWPQLAAVLTRFTGEPLSLPLSSCPFK